MKFAYGFLPIVLTVVAGMVVCQAFSYYEESATAPEPDYYAVDDGYDPDRIAMLQHTSKGRSWLGIASRLISNYLGYE